MTFINIHSLHLFSIKYFLPLFISIFLISSFKISICIAAKRPKKLPNTKSIFQKKTSVSKPLIKGGSTTKPIKNINTNKSKNGLKPSGLTMSTSSIKSTPSRKGLTVENIPSTKGNSISKNKLNSTTPAINERIKAYRAKKR